MTKKVEKSENPKKITRELQNAKKITKPVKHTKKIIREFAKYKKIIREFKKSQKKKNYKRPEKHKKRTCAYISMKLVFHLYLVT